MKYHLLFFLIFHLILFSDSYAQQPVQIMKLQGFVKGDSSLSYSTILLLHAKDSSIYRRTITDSTGYFEMEGDFRGDFILSVTHIGYSTYYSPIFSTDTASGSTISFSIKLIKSDVRLANVEVKKAMPVMERKLDRVIIHVENNIVSNGESVMELLRTLPGIVVDGSDNIYIKGKSDIRVIVDGREVLLKEEQLKTFLSGMSANNIKDIEIISNPPARYAAEGAGGIIQIITKTRSGDGISSNVYSGYSQGVYGRTTFGGSLLAKENKILFSASYDFTHATGFFDAVENRDFNTATPPIFFHQVSSNTTTSTNQYFKAGVDWKITKNQHVAVFLDGALSKKDNPFHSDLYVSDSGNKIDSTFVTNNFTQTNYSSKNLNANYRLLLDSSGHSLEANYSRLWFNEISASNYYSLFYNQDMQQNRLPQSYTFFNNENAYIDAYKIDYQYRLPAQIKGEAGLKYTSSVTDNDIKYYTDQNILDTTRSNHFIYKEDIMAAYVSASGSFKKLNAELGLRYENTRAQLNLTTENSIINRYLNNFFPTIFLEYNLNKSNKINFTSGRRVRRPGYSDLNPFIFYYDPFSYSQGNPYLLPEFTYTNELSYTFKNSSISLGYSNTSNIINETILQNDFSKTVIYGYENAGNSNSLYIEAFVPITITRWWDANADANLSYTHNYGNLSYGIYSNKLAGVYVNFSNTFTVAKRYLIQANMLYFSPSLDGISKYSGMSRFSLGLKRSFFKNKLSLNLRLTDIFLTDIVKQTTTAFNENITLRQVRDTRRVGLTITYNFNKGRKPKERAIQFGGEDEKNRLDITPKTN